MMLELDWTDSTEQMTDEQIPEWPSPSSLTRRRPWCVQTADRCDPGLGAKCQPDLAVWRDERIVPRRAGLSPPAWRRAIGARDPRFPGAAPRRPLRATSCAAV